MTRKYCILMLISIFIGNSILSIIEAETLNKAPKKPKPKIEFPKRINLPPPFSNWSSCDLALKMYPEYNCQNGFINANLVGSINKAIVWNQSGKNYLLVLFETHKPGAEGLSNAEAGKTVDLALYTLLNNEITLSASRNEIFSYRWFGSAHFDLAPYKLNSKETAFGVCFNPGISGGFREEMLCLFRLRDNAIQPIFNRYMIETEFYSGYENLSNKLQAESILEIVPKASGMNEFKIITHFYQFNDDEEVERDKIIKITSEIWRWNENSQEYELSN